MRTNLRGLLLAVTILTLVARVTFPVSAQNPTGSIRGTIIDPQGAVIQNAAVTVTNKATGDVRKTSSGDDGIYQVETLLPGEYEVKIEAQGFATQILTVIVQVGNTTTGDVSLRVGATSDVVDITAEAPIIDKQNYKIDGVITRQKIDALPLNGRNFLQLALLEPGVAVSVANPGQYNNLFNVSIGGSNSDLTRVTVDGGNVVDPVTGGTAQNFSTETIQEFQISTFNFDLSTGTTSVGAINIVSRTGTNDLHGSAFLYFRDDSLAALPTFIRPSKDFDPDFRRYQYGGSIGGPIKKDSAFFFGNLEVLDQKSVISVFHTGFQAFRTLNTSFTSPYDGIVANVRGDFKLSDKNNLFARYSYDDNEAFSPVDDNSLPSNWRVNQNNDHNLQGGLTTILTQNIVNDLRFNFHRITNQSTPPTSSECPPSEVGCIGLGGPEVRVLGSNIRFGNNVNAPQDRVLKRFQTTDNINWQKGSHRIRFGGEWEHDRGTGTFAFADPAVIILHDPTSVLGVNALIAANPAIPAPLKPALTIPVPAAFTSGATLTANDILRLPIVTGVVGFGDPGQPPPFGRDIAKQSNRLRFFGQDSWLIRPGFTFSYGVAYQYETNLANHDLVKPQLLKALVGDIGKPPKDKNNFAPSVGFAWDVRNDGKTVLRGGAGIYYDTVLFLRRLGERALIGPAGNGRVQVFGAFFQNNIAPPPLPPLPAPLNLINPALGASINFRTIPTKFTGLNFLNLLSAPPPAIGLPAIAGLLQQAGAGGFTTVDVFKTAPFAGSLNLLDPDLETPYSQQFSVGLQRQLPYNMAISTDFVLRKSVHTPFAADFNLFDRSAARGGSRLPRCVGLQAINPAAQCSNGPLFVLQSSGREQYKALLVKLDKRFTSRYQFTASYALSSLTGFYTNSGEFTRSSDKPGPEDQTDWFRFRGPLAADVRHRFTFSGVVNLPWDIQASLIAVYASRPPFNARLSSTIDLDGDGTFGDNLPGLEINDLGRGTNEDELRRLVNDFNAKFVTPTSGISPIVLPRDIDFGDNFQSHDIRFSKAFKLGERASLQGFVEVFNLFNISNLVFDSSTQRLGPSFGQPTTRAGQNFGTGGPRAFQLGGRFTF